MLRLGILGVESYAAALLLEVSHNRHFECLAMAGDYASEFEGNIPVVSPKQLINQCDAIIADGSDMRFITVLFEALRCGRNVLLLNALSLHLNYLDELNKTAAEAGVSIVPVLPFWLPLNFPLQTIRKQAFNFIDFKLKKSTPLQNADIRNSLFLLHFLSGSPFLKLNKLSPCDNANKDNFLHLSVKFENGFGATAGLQYSPFEKSDCRLAIFNGQTEFVHEIRFETLTGYYLHFLNLACHNQPIGWQLSDLQYFIAWFAKKIQPVF
jgi:hypothetical protein